jgi:hypothetical protein
MASNKAMTTKVMDFGRVLLPVGRRVVEEFFKTSIVVSPVVSTETTTRDLHCES